MIVDDSWVIGSTLTDISVPNSKPTQAQITFSITHVMLESSIYMFTSDEVWG